MSRGAELERRAHRVAHGQAEEGPQRPITDAVRRSGRNRGRPRLAPPHVFFLARGLDGSRPNLAHVAHRFVRTFAQLHQQAGGDGPGPAQTPLAVDEHVEPQAQSVPNHFARHRPRLFEVGSRRLAVRYRRVPPLHVPVLHLLAEIRHSQVVDLPVGDQADHRGRTPVSNRVEVGGQVACPTPRDPVRIGLAGAQGDADPALAVSRGHRGDAEGAVLAGSCRLHGNEAISPWSSGARRALSAQGVKSPVLHLHALF